MHPDAHMDAMAESDLIAAGTRHIETVWIFELALVAVGRGEQHHDAAAAGRDVPDRLQSCVTVREKERIGDPSRTASLTAFGINSGRRRSSCH